MRAWIIWGTEWIDLGDSVSFSTSHSSYGPSVYEAHWKWDATIQVNVEFVVTEIHGVTSFRRMPRPAWVVKGDTLDLEIKDVLPL